MVIVVITKDNKIVILGNLVCLVLVFKILAGRRKFNKGVNKCIKQKVLSKLVAV